MARTAMQRDESVWWCLVAGDSEESFQRTARRNFGCRFDRFLHTQNRTTWIPQDGRWVDFDRRGNSHRGVRLRPLRSGAEASHDRGRPASLCDSAL